MAVFFADLILGVLWCITILLNNFYLFCNCYLAEIRAFVRICLCSGLKVPAGKALLLAFMDVSVDLGVVTSWLIDGKDW